MKYLHVCTHKRQQIPFAMCEVNQQCEIDCIFTVYETCIIIRNHYYSYSYTVMLLAYNYAKTFAINLL